LNRISRDALEKFYNHEHITRCMTTAYFGAVRAANKDKYEEAVIENFSRYKLIEILKEQMPWISRSSMYRAIDSLFEYNFFTMDGKNLLLPLVAGGHIKGGPGYIDLPTFIFKEDFYNSSMREKRVTLKLLSSLNNEKKKTQPFNTKSKKNPTRAADLMSWLKVNRPAHIRGVMDSIKKFFKVQKKAHGTYMIQLNDVSSKTITSLDKTFMTTSTKFDKIIELLKEYNIYKDIQGQNAKEVAAALYTYTIPVIRKTLFKLCSFRRDNIDSFYGYTTAIARQITEA